MIFKTQESSEFCLYMISLSLFRSGLTTFNAAELLDAAMTRFDYPAHFGIFQPNQLRQPEIIGRPISNVALRCGRLEYFDHAVPLEVNNINLF